MPLRRCLRAFFPSILAIPLIYCAGPVWASAGFQPINRDELKMTNEPQAPGAPAIILYREVNRDDLGRSSHGGVQIIDSSSPGRHEDNYFRIKILTEAGRKFGDIEIPYSKQFEDINFIRARTIRPDGSIANFDGAVVEKTLFKNQTARYDVKILALPDVQVGSIIEYFYTIEYKSVWIRDSHWIISQELFTRHAKFTLRQYEGDESLNLRWTQHLPSGMPSPKQGPDGIVRLEVDSIPAFQREEFMPPEDDLKARIDFIYFRTYEASEPDANKYWKKIGKRRNGELEDFVSRRGTIQQAIGQIISPGDSDEVKLQKLYARVQQLRNTSFEVAKTEEEKRREKDKSVAESFERTKAEEENKRGKNKTAPNADDIWKQGYGDRTQLSWLFLALARTAGFEAYGVWVSDRRNYIFNLQQMDSQRLDRSLVLVKAGGQDFYFDPGAEFAPFGMLNWEETGVQGVRLDKDGGTWIQTAVPDSSLSQIQRKADLKLSESGDLEGRLTVTFTGLEGLRRRVDERNEDEVARRKYLEDAVKECVPAASEVQLSNNPDWSSSGTPLVADFHITIPGWVSRGGRLAFLPVGLFGATEKHLFDHAERVHPVYFEFPAQKLDDVSIELPAGWQVSSLPKAQNLDFHVVAYSLGAENNRTLRLTRKLDINIISMDTKYYSPLRSFFQGVKDGDDQKVVLTPGSALTSK
jgi:Domain of Unknown Function with PDB structure (DUF3857)